MKMDKRNEGQEKWRMIRKMKKDVRNQGEREGNSIGRGGRM